MKTLMKISLTFALTVSLVSLAIAQQPDDKDYDKFLIKCLEDENFGIRTSAAQLVGERKVEAAVEPLIKMMKIEKRYCARIVAALALYKIGNTKALPELKKLAACDNCKTVRHIATAIVLEMQNVQFVQKEPQPTGSQ